MKKTYFSPMTVVVNIDSEVAILAESNLTTLDPEQDEQVVDPSTEEYGGKFSSRRNDMWEDEEDDQY